MIERAVTDVFDDRFHRTATYALEQFPERPVDLTTISRGNRKQTAVARFADRAPMVVQLCATPRWLEPEALLLGCIADRTTVPVPAVHGSGTVDDIGYLLTEYVPGDDLHARFTDLNADKRRMLVRSLGEALAQLHEAFQFDGYGRLVVADGSLAATRGEWSEWFTEYGLEAIRRLPESFEPLRTELEAFIKSEVPVHNPPAHLYPWDFRPGNMLVDGGTITAIVDWETPCAASAAVAVAKAEYLIADWYGIAPEALRAAFRDGYSSVRPYPELRPEHQVAAIADSAVDSNGVVTNPLYPELGPTEAIAFHRQQLQMVVERLEKA
ncbi:phosphotransferase family protein [Natrarchaeobaculum sulfurireducens]|uniref:Aminoglycoside phosphotransferase n=1 Tax=Natrarchaeobaculum sulfurireducens TaxID=2044521 RepID=A0A346PK89_9EURY|nr:phosphotransferase [Natrarchaeobaculum sulfurireducens]AXR79934.1 Aminoglycoside phosphotransferase [Natrarchaeobaculum sulfurireducens]